MKLRTALLAAAAVCLAGAAQADQLRLMTGPQGGTWVPLGGQLEKPSHRGRSPWTWTLTGGSSTRFGTWRSQRSHQECASSRRSIGVCGHSCGIVCIQGPAMSRFGPRSCSYDRIAGSTNRSRQPEG